jgi:hypothetical protein
MEQHQILSNWLKRAISYLTQPCRYSVDGQMDCLHHALVGIAGPDAWQCDLYMVERIEGESGS